MCSFVVEKNGEGKRKLSKPSLSLEVLISKLRMQRDCSPPFLDPQPVKSHTFGPSCKFVDKVSFFFSSTKHFS